MPGNGRSKAGGIWWAVFGRQVGSGRHIVCGIWEVAGGEFGPKL